MYKLIIFNILFFSNVLLSSEILDEDILFKNLQIGVKSYYSYCYGGQEDMKMTLSELNAYIIRNKSWLKEIQTIKESCNSRSYLGYLHTVKQFEIKLYYKRMYETTLQKLKDLEQKFNDLEKKLASYEPSCSNK